MEYFKGIGLAAPQVGINKMLIVVDIGNGPIELANPEVIESTGYDIKEEGCLSVPETIVNVKRSYKVIVKGMNDKGKIVEIKTEGLLARVLQHEIDHLNGKLIIDYMRFPPKMKS
jgi:peptide deformylase